MSTSKAILDAGSVFDNRAAAIALALLTGERGSVYDTVLSLLREFDSAGTTPEVDVVLRNLRLAAHRYGPNRRLAIVEDTNRAERAAARR